MTEEILNAVTMIQMELNEVKTLVIAKEYARAILHLNKVGTGLLAVTVKIQELNLGEK